MRELHPRHHCFNLERSNYRVCAPLIHDVRAIIISIKYMNKLLSGAWLFYHCFCPFQS